MAKQKRGNDAIPSWSGFNYQGKVMLLYILIKIGEVLPTGRINDYSVEIEKREDFVIMHNDQSETFHQVKATLSKSKWGSYSDSLDKLLQHRNSSDNILAPCIFIVAKQISDWNETTNPYRNQVSLFTFMGNFVGVSDVRNKIILQIQSLGTQVNQLIGHEEVVYGELCLFIDEKIAQMHREAFKKRKYKIPFIEFMDTITKAIEKQNESEEFYLKERVFERANLSFQQSLESLCFGKCHRLLSDCEIDCAAKKAYNEILKLPSIIQYCKIINPNLIDGWDDPLQCIHNLSNDKIRDAIYELFYESKTPNKVEGDSNSVYL